MTCNSLGKRVSRKILIHDGRSLFHVICNIDSNHLSHDDSAHGDTLTRSARLYDASSTTLIIFSCMKYLVPRPTTYEKVRRRKYSVNICNGQLWVYVRNTINRFRDIV